ncbi:MAG: hypothetical protein WB870_15545 [Gallionellaceae bacterium]
MPQTFVQEIDILLSNKTQFTIYVSNTVGTSDFEAELFLHENANSLSKVGIKANHRSGTFAFQEAINSVLSYLSKHSLEAQSVDSPCNAPFIDKLQQIKVLSESGINVDPTINGQ